MREIHLIPHLEINELQGSTTSPPLHWEEYLSWLGILCLIGLLARLKCISDRIGGWPEGSWRRCVRSFRLYMTQMAKAAWGTATKRAIMAIPTEPDILLRRFCWQEELYLFGARVLVLGRQSFCLRSSKVGWNYWDLYSKLVAAGQAENCTIRRGSLVILRVLVVRVLGLIVLTSRVLVVSSISCQKCWIVANLNTVNLISW